MSQLFHSWPNFNKPTKRVPSQGIQCLLRHHRIEVHFQRICNTSWPSPSWQWQKRVVVHLGDHGKRSEEEFNLDRREWLSTWEIAERRKEEEFNQRVGKDQRSGLFHAGVSRFRFYFFASRVIVLHLDYLGLDSRHSDSTTAHLLGKYW